MSIQYGVDEVPFIDLGLGYKIRLENEEVTDEVFVEKAREELRETPELKVESVKELRLLLQSEPNFDYPDDDAFLLQFLRPCKFYSKSAFERIQKYYKFSDKHKKVLSNLTVESISYIFEQNIVKYLPKRDQHGRRILFIQCGKNWKPSKKSINDVFRTIQVSLRSAMREPLTQINGVSVILDMKGLTLNHIISFTPSFAAMALEWIQDCIALRLKGVYIVNNSVIFNMLFAIFKPFINSKLRKRIYFLGNDYETLVDLVGKKSLPVEFGGTLPVPFVDGALIVELMKLFDIYLSKADHVGYDVAPNNVISSDAVTSVLKHFNKDSNKEQII
ncbi:unnamed protein product [Diamesa serratosioi]